MHRNSQKRIIQLDTTYFITTITKDRFPYFENDVLCKLFIEELKICKKLKEFNLYTFCILKDHIHLMIEPNEKYNIIF
jgi:REP element-mobilizing transposase RayT